MFLSNTCKIANHDETKSFETVTNKKEFNTSSMVLMNTVGSEALRLINDCRKNYAFKPVNENKIKQMYKKVAAKRFLSLLLYVHILRT